MDLVSKLVSYTHSAFDRSPGEFIAFRARHLSDAYRYAVRGGVLTGYLGEEPIFTARLSEHTIESLIGMISEQPGMSVIYSAPAAVLGHSAETLIDAKRRQIDSNGDCVFAYSSLLYAIMHAFAIELDSAKSAISAMLDQMNIRTADDDLLSEWADHFGYPRKPGESDVELRTRVLREAPRPRSNNMAIALAIEQEFGNAASVPDVSLWGGDFPLHGADDLLSIDYDGRYFHNASAKQVFGLFDVEVEPQILSDAFAEYLARLDVATELLIKPSPTDPDGEIELQRELALEILALRNAAAGLMLETEVDENAIRTLIESMRAAGTQLRQLTLRLPA